MSYGPDRQAAMDTMVTALDSYVIKGNVVALCWTCLMPRCLWRGTGRGQDFRMGWLRGGGATIPSVDWSWCHTLSFCPFPDRSVDWSWCYTHRVCLFPDRSVDWSWCYTHRFCLFPDRSVDWSWCHTLSFCPFPDRSVDWSWCYTLSFCLFPDRSVDWSWCYTLSFCLFPDRSVDWSWCYTLRFCPSGTGFDWTHYHADCACFQWQVLIEVGVILSDPAVFSDKGWLKLVSYSQILPFSVTRVDWSWRHTLRFCHCQWQGLLKSASYSHILPLWVTSVDWGQHHTLRSCHCQWQVLIEVSIILSESACFQSHVLIEVSIILSGSACFQWQVLIEVSITLSGSACFQWQVLIEVSIILSGSACFHWQVLIETGETTLRFSVCLFSVMKVDWSWGRTLRCCPLAVSNAQSGAHSCCEIWYEQNLAQSSMKCTC